MMREWSTERECREIGGSQRWMDVRKQKVDWFSMDGLWETGKVR